jgi:hypothetical protein
VVALRDNYQGFQKKFRNYVLGWSVPFWAEDRTADGGREPTQTAFPIFQEKNTVLPGWLRWAAMDQDKAFVYKLLSESSTRPMGSRGAL